MIRLVGSVVLLLLAACATAGRDEERPNRERVSVSSGMGDLMDVTIQRDGGVHAMIVEASRDAVWRALPAVYQEVGLPAPAADNASWTVAVQPYDHAPDRPRGHVTDPGMWPGCDG
jgi:uncharacterized lipoprotein